MNNIFITNMLSEWEARKTGRKVAVVNWILKRLGFQTHLALPDNTGIMTNVEQRMNMYHLLTQALAYSVPGDIVELGCSKGKSAMLFRVIMDSYDSQRELHVYDSFEGLPEVKPEDGGTPFRQGALATTQSTLLNNFASQNLKPPVIHPGWFDQTLPNELPDQIAFAHLDGDLYSSIKVSLEHVYPRLSKGAICLVDDYADPDVYDGWNDLPGVKVACDEYLADKPEEVALLYAGNYAHGYFRKLSNPIS